MASVGEVIVMVKKPRKDDRLVDEAPKRAPKPKRASKVKVPAES